MHKSRHESYLQTGCKSVLVVPIAYTFVLEILLHARALDSRKHELLSTFDGEPRAAFEVCSIDNWDYSIESNCVRTFSEAWVHQEKD